MKNIQILATVKAVYLGCEDNEEHKKRKKNKEYKQPKDHKYRRVSFNLGRKK